MKVREKKCKECGQLFTPENPRQQYCKRDHYRPCPTCGRKVFIKYLSDPTPRCADCKKAGIRVGSKFVVELSSVTDTEISGEYVTRKYVGRSSCRYINDHVYLVKLERQHPYGYLVHALKDITNGDEFDPNEVVMCISSMNSWHYFFKEVIE